MSPSLAPIPERVRGVLGGFARHLLSIRPGGCMVLVVPPDGFGVPAKSFSGGPQQREQLASILTKEGLFADATANQIEEVRSIVAAPPPKGAIWLVYVVYAREGLDLIGAAPIKPVLMTKGGDA